MPPQAGSSPLDPAEAVVDHRLERSPSVYRPGNTLVCVRLTYGCMTLLNGTDNGRCQIGIDANAGRIEVV